MILIQIAYLICAYLIGSIPYMLLLSRARGFDLTGEPDFHIAMYRKFGRLEGASGIFVDFAKGIISVLAGYYAHFDLGFVAAAAVVVTCGQMWPVFQKFNGEKGNTTGMGACATMLIAYGAGMVFYVGIGIMIIGFLVRTIPRFVAAKTWRERFGFGGPASNSLPLGILLGFATMPALAALMHIRIEIILSLLCIFLVIVIRRLTAGIRHDMKEPRSSKSSILFNRLFFDRSYY